MRLSPLLSAETVDFWLQRFDRSRSLSRVLARLVDRQLVAADTLQLRFEANRHFRGFLPGQHVNLSAEVDGRRLTRCYSFTSLPASGRRFDLVVKRHPQGRMSRFLTQQLRLGEAVELDRVFGDPAPASEADLPRLFLAGGVGITPLIAQVRALAATASTTPSTLLYWAKRRADLCFTGELESFAARLPNFSVRYFLTQGEQPASRISAELVASLLPDFADCSVQVCGPAGFVEQARAHLAERVRHFRSESFEPLRVAAESSGEVVVKLLRRGLELPVRRDRTLLEALEATGLSLPSGCRMGICNTCACERLSGDVRDLRTRSVCGGDPAPVRLCVSAAESDLCLDL